MATPVAKRARVVVDYTVEDLLAPPKFEVLITKKALDELDEQTEVMAYTAHRTAVDAAEAIIEADRQTAARIASFTKPKAEQLDDDTAPPNKKLRAPPLPPMKKKEEATGLKSSRFSSTCPRSVCV